MSSDAASPKPKPLSFMEKLDPAVFLYRPAEAPSSPDEPKLIIITSWTDALDVHIAKYVNKYREVFPRSQIALMKSTSALFFRPPTIVDAARKLVPAIRSVFNTGLLPSSRPELLIHCFSNGGSSSLASLYDAYAESAAEGEDKRLPLHATIIDSAPSEFEAARLVAFLQVGMGTVPRLLTLPVFYLLGYSWELLVSLGVLTNWMHVWGTAHNSKEFNNEVRRVYIYSETDQLVNYKTILAHADKAEEQGFKVQKEKFIGSAHVAHARKDEVRYWDIVRKVWFGSE